MMERLGDIAVEAGQVIMRHYETPPQATFKSDDSPVTEADIEADRLITAKLREISAEVTIISEESGENHTRHTTDEGQFWLVDPLDGTRGFIKRRGDFTVNIALIEKQKPIAGVIYAPVYDTLYYGAEGIGCFRSKNKAPAEIITTRKPDLKNMGALISSEHSHDEKKWLNENFGIASTKNMSSSIKFCVIAEGLADIYPRGRPTWEWDTAAGHAILNAAGGEITTFDGAPLKYNKKDYLNSGFIAYGYKI